MHLHYHCRNMIPPAAASSQPEEMYQDVLGCKIRMYCIDHIVILLIHPKSRTQTSDFFHTIYTIKSVNTNIQNIIHSRD